MSENGYWSIMRIIDKNGTFSLAFSYLNFQPVTEPSILVE